MTLAFAALMTVGLLVYLVSLYNGAQQLANLIPEVASNIAVLLKKRTDLIGKLTAIVESYDLHESGVQTKVSGNLGGTGDAGNAQGVISRLASLRMAFPELRADGLYETLMGQLTVVENDIASRREEYNATVRAYNTMLVQFPNNLMLPRFGFQPKPFLNEQELAS